MTEQSPSRLGTQLQHIHSEAPRLYFHQEAFQFQGAGLEQAGEVSQGLQLSQAWLFPFPIHQVSQTQMERCLHGGQPHTQLFLSAPAPLTASTVQQDPTAMELSFCLPPSPQLPWVLVVPDSGELRLMKAGTQWLQFTPAQTSTILDTLQQDLATLLPLSKA